MLLVAHVGAATAAGSPALKDIAYGPDPDQRYDLYRPAGSKIGKKLVSTAAISF